jgi:hypothetical protein
MFGQLRYAIGEAVSVHQKLQKRALDDHIFCAQK